MTVPHRNTGVSHQDTNPVDELPELYDLLRSCARQLKVAADAIDNAYAGPVKDLRFHLDRARAAVRQAWDDVAGVLEP